MKKYLLLFAFLLPFITRSQVPICPDKNQKGYSCGNVEENILSELPHRNYRMPTHFNVIVTHSFTKQKDKNKANEVARLCSLVLNDPDFWNAVENYPHYKYAVFETGGIKSNISGAQIVNCLINGSPDDDRRPAEVDIILNIKLYGGSFRLPFETALAKEVGDGSIYNKRWFFRKHSVSDIGSNWIHEYAHTKGLVHCFYCNMERDYSIPYVINRIFDEVANKY